MKPRVKPSEKTMIMSIGGILQAPRSGQNGKVYVGTNCDSVRHGSCAEVIAIGSAVTAGERESDTIAAVLGGESERILPPCGNCRANDVQL